MDIRDLITYFHTDNLAKLSRLTGFSRQTLYRWQKGMPISLRSQLLIEALTSGALRANR